MPFERRFSPFDRILMEVDHALRTSLALAPPPIRPSPASSHVAPALSETDRRHVVGLMRINHSGEVCAQALYLGQAAVATTPQLRAHLRHAAIEEADHLAWCAQRLETLHSMPSLFNPFWYLGSYAIGVVAGLAGDGYNLGFIVETERQVEAHLKDHLTSLPEEDTASRAILAEMMADEARHAEQADAAGARVLPRPVPDLMAACSQVMKRVAYRI
ncbi:MAG: 2-polyprenyl-3-methyl-6-methoxy-1,4-benzoquinone monooxygenase [Lysobacteraceae bacterium]